MWIRTIVLTVGSLFVAVTALLAAEGDFPASIPAIGFVVLILLELYSWWGAE